MTRGTVMLFGQIATHASWRWIFLLNVPLGLIGLLLIWRLFPRRDDRMRRRFDATGLVLTAIALAMLVQGLTGLTEQHGGVGRNRALLGLTALAATATVWHARRASEPVLDLRANGIATFRVASGSAGCVLRVAIDASPFLLPLMFQIGFGMDAFQAGSMLLRAGTVNPQHKYTPKFDRHSDLRAFSPCITQAKHAIGPRG